MKLLRPTSILGGIATLLATTIAPLPVFAQTAPTLQQSFPNILLSKTISPTASQTTVTAPGGLSVTIPTGALSNQPVTFEILEGSATTVLRPTAFT